MRLEKATSWRNMSGKICTIFSLLLFFSVMDGIVELFRHPANLLEVLPGESRDISGYLRTDTADLNSLLFESGSEGVKVSFLEFGKGYWLGGNTWRGQVSVEKNVHAGDTTVTIRQVGDSSGKPLMDYLVRVYRNAEAMREASKSLIRRYGNMSPWTVMGAMVPLVLLGLFTNYLLSTRRDQLLAEVGEAEIYHLLPHGDEEFLVSFGLGTAHGLEPGTPLTVLDRLRVPVCSSTVDQVFEKDAKALVPKDCTVKIGYVVRWEGKPREVHGGEGE